MVEWSNGKVGYLVGWRTDRSVRLLVRRWIVWFLIGRVVVWSVCQFLVDSKLVGLFVGGLVVIIIFSHGCSPCPVPGNVGV